MRVHRLGFLFSDTVWANIVYGRPNATRQDVEAAAQAAQAGLPQMIGTRSPEYGR
jgi:ATP-binding cassette subfamily B protein